MGGGACWVCRERGEGLVGCVGREEEKGGFVEYVGREGRGLEYVGREEGKGGFVEYVGREEEKAGGGVC